MRHRKPLRIVLIVLASLLVLYLIPSLYLGCKLNKIILQSYQSFGQDNPDPKTLSDTAYQRLNCHTPEEAARAKQETFHHTFPLTLFWPGGSKSVYWYTYEKEAPNGALNRSDGGVIVTHQWKDGKWVISDVLAPEVPLSTLFWDSFFDED